MQLTANTSAAPMQRWLSRPLGASPSGVVWVEQQCASPTSFADDLLRRTTAVFFRDVANSLEKHRAEFHYSVIGRFATVFLAAGYVGGPLLNEDDTASDSQVGVSAARVEVAPSLAHETVITDVSTQSDWLRFRTSERKINSND